MKRLKGKKRPPLSERQNKKIVYYFFLKILKSMMQQLPGVALRRSFPASAPLLVIPLRPCPDNCFYQQNKMRPVSRVGKNLTSVVREAAHREIFSKSYEINPKSDCIYHFPIDLDPKIRPFAFKSIGKW